MEIIDLISPESVVPNLRATSKKLALQELARRAAEIAGLPERAVFDVLLERERLGTTGVGNGIAIPHGKLPNLDRLYGLFARLEKPIGFDSIDEQPVDLIFLLLAPESGWSRPSEGPGPGLAPAARQGRLRKTARHRQRRRALCPAHRQPGNPGGLRLSAG